MKALFTAFLLLMFAPLVKADGTPVPQDGLIVAGQLNPGMEGRAAAFEAKVLDIKTAPDTTQVLKLELPYKDTQPLWAITFVPIAKDEVRVGDRLIFKGYVAATDSVDRSGKLRELVENSAAVLRAQTIESPR